MSSVRTYQTPPVLRRTSTYTLDVDTDVPGVVADQLVQNCSVVVFASGVDHGRAFIRFRAENDEQAVEIANRLTDLDGVLHTGYGVNRRDVVR